MTLRRLLTTATAALLLVTGCAPDDDEPARGIDYPAFEALPEQETLPALLTTWDGAPVDSASAWEQTRRAELLGLLEHYAYGAAPPLPASTRAEVIARYDDLFDGAATLTLLAVHTGPDEALTIDVLLVTPNAAEGPVPVFVGPNFFGNHTTLDDPRVPLETAWLPPRGEGVVDNQATEAARGTSAERWPFETVISRGYALATFYHGDIDPDRDDFTDGLHALLPASLGTERGPHDGGTLAAWSWGVSRVLDALETEPTLDTSRVAVVGHSRNGKVALWSAAQDPRIAMAISNMSGCMGAALSRRRQGETLQLINGVFPHWFATSLRDFNTNEDHLPFDQHALVAMLAPRPVLIVSGVEDAWADPEGEFLGARSAEPVYALFGAAPLGADAWPASAPAALIDSPLGYALMTGGHAITPEGWAVFLDFADRHLR